MSDITLGIKLTFDGKAVEGGVTVSRDQFRKLASEAKAAGDAAAGGFTSAAQGVRSVSEQLSRLQTAAAGYLSVTQALSGAKWVVEQASAMQQLEARLKVATANAVEFSKAYEGVFQVANKWGGSVEQTAGAFARLNPIVAQMGGNSAVTLKMLDGLAASLRLSGATGAETSAVLLQFAQAMGSGKVGGDEFRSMMENAEPLMRAVATQMGKTTAELRQMSEEGKLTSSVFGNALLPAIDKLAEKAATIPLGIGQAMEVLKNNLAKDFGKEFSEQSNRIADAIKAISEHTPEMAQAVRMGADALVFLAQAGATVAAGAAAAAIVKQTQAAYGSVTAYNAARAARLADAAAAEAQAAAEVERLAVVKASILADQERAVAMRASATKAIEATSSAATLSYAIRAKTDAMNESKAASRLLMETDRSLAVVNGQLTAAEATLTTTQRNRTEATAAGSLASRAAATASGLAGAAITALGGPIGVVITLLTAGATAWALWGDKAEASAKKANDAIEGSLALLERYQKEEKFGSGDVGIAKAGLAEADAKIKKLRQQLAALTAEDSTGGVYTNEAGYVAVQKEITEALGKREKILGAVAEAEKRVAAASGNERLSAANEYSKLVSDLKWQEKVIKEYDEKLLNLQRSFADKMAETADDKQDALRRNHKAALAAMLEERKQALESLPDFKENKAAVDARADAMVKSYQASVKRALEVLKHEHEQFRLSTEQFITASGAMEANAIDVQIAALKEKLAAATKESERIPIRANIEELQKDLDQIPLRTKAAMEDAATKSQEALGKLAAIAGQSLDPIAVAYQKFWNETQEIYQKAARDNQQDVIEAWSAAWGRVLDQTQFDTAKQQYEALFADMQERIEAVRQAAEKDGGMLAGFAADAKVKEIRDQMIPALNELIAKMKEAEGTSPVNEKTVTEAVRATQKAVNEISPTWKKFSDDIERSLTDSLMRSFETGGKDGGKVLVDTVRNTLKTAVFKFAVQALVQPVLASAGQALGLVGQSAAGGASAGAGGGSTNLFSTGNSLYNLYNGGASSLYNSVATSSLGGTLGLSSVAADAAGATVVGGFESIGVSMAGTGAGQVASLTSLGSSLGAALPYVGLAIAAASLLSGAFGSGGGPKSIGYAGDYDAMGLKPSAAGGNAFQGMFAAGVEAIKDAYASALKDFGRTADLRVYLAGSMNPEGGGPDQFGAKYAVNGGDVLKMTGYGDQSYRMRLPEKLMAEEVPKVVLSALEATQGLPPLVEAYLDTLAAAKGGIGKMKADAVASALVNVKALDTLIDAMDDMGLATEHLSLDIVAAAGGAAVLSQKIVTYHDGYFAAGEKEIGAQEKLRSQVGTVFDDLKLAMPTTREGFRALVEGLDLSADAGQEAFTALMDVAGAFGQVADFTARVETLRPAFTKMGLSASAVTDALIEQAGGSDALAASLSSYYDAYFSAAEKQAAAQAGLAAGFEDLGLAMPTTREGFRDLVEGLELTADGGGAALVSLLALAPAFAEVANAAEATGKAQEEAASAARKAAQETRESAKGTRFDLIGRYSSDAQQLDYAKARLAHGFAALGEAVPQTADDFVRLAVSANAGMESGQKLIGALNDLAPYFDVVTGAASQAADALATHTATAAAMVDRYSTDEQKLAAAQQTLKTGFAPYADWGIDVPATAGDYRDLARWSKAAGSEGQGLLATLEALAPAFDVVIGAADAAVAQAQAVANQQRGLDIQLMEAQGRAADALAARRSDELAAMDASLRATQEAVWAAQDLTEAQQKLTQAQETAANGALAALQRSVDAGKAALIQSYEADREALQTAYDDTAKLRQAGIEGQNDKLGKIGEVASKLASALDRTRIESDGRLAAQRAAAQATLSGAIDFAGAGNSLTDFAGLDVALDALAKPAEQLYASFEDYARDQGRIFALESDLKLQAEAQKSVAELTLEALKSANEQATKDFDAEMKAAETRHAADLAALDDLVTQAKNQIDVLSGIDIGVQSVADAILGMNATLADYAATAGRYYAPVVEPGAATLASYAVGSAYIPFDQTANIHQGEIIIDARSSDVLRRYGINVQGQGGGAELVAEIKALNTRIEKMQAQLDEANEHAKRTANAVNGNPEAPLLVETV